MNSTKAHIRNYLEYCKSQKCLDAKTLKAYQIDLRQFSEQISNINIPEITSEILEQYISKLHKQYKPKTVKRKIASVKALFHYLDYKEIINNNPFNKILIHFREPVKLPKTIPLHTSSSLIGPRIPIKVNITKKGVSNISPLTAATALSTKHMDIILIKVTNGINKKVKRTVINADDILNLRKPANSIKFSRPAKTPINAGTRIIIWLTIKLATIPNWNTGYITSNNTTKVIFSSTIARNIQFTFLAFIFRPNFPS